MHAGHCLTAERSDALPLVARHGLVSLVVLAHAIAGWGVLQLVDMPVIIQQAAPLWVNWITPASAQNEQQPVHHEHSAAHVATPSPRTAAPTAMAAPASDNPAPTTSSATSATTSGIAAVPASALVDSATPAVPLPSTPKILPASSVAYLEPPQVKYPSLSRRLGETGQVTLRVLIGIDGRPAQIEVSVSSGSTRLDEAALAAMRTARFKPYSENGVAQSAWTLAPITFSLEN